MFKFLFNLLLLCLIVLGAWWLWENVPATHSIYGWIKTQLGKLVGAKQS